MRLNHWFVRADHRGRGAAARLRARPMGAAATMAFAGSLFVQAPHAVAGQGAEEPPDRHPPAQLALAQICASEASVQTETDDCAAIAHVLRRRARKVTFSEMALRYSTRVFQRDRRDARRWIAHLTPAGDQPTGWPEALPWSKWQPRWLALYRHAGKILRNEVPSPCAHPPDHWGGSMDDWRAIKAGWERVDCGETLNHFWAIPGNTG